MNVAVLAHLRIDQNQCILCIQCASHIVLSLNKIDYVLSVV